MCEYINGVIIQEDFTMEKTIYDENNGLWYELRGDYYFPCLTVPAQEQRPIGFCDRTDIFIVTNMSLRGIIMSLRKARGRI